jgi:hypothetical protein
VQQSDHWLPAAGEISALSIMPANLFDPRFDDLPATLPIFPLSGAILLPDVELPLNIFEPRYLNMTLDALAATRMIGMVQPRPDADSEPVAVCDTGCAGRITSFSETADGRLLIILTGVCRFDIRSEIAPRRGYRRVAPDWQRFAADLGPPEAPDMTRQDLIDAVEKFLGDGTSNLDWGLVNKVPEHQLVDLLAMHLPFDVTEKQALVEAMSRSDRSRLLVGLCEMRGRIRTSDGLRPH